MSRETLRSPLPPVERLVAATGRAGSGPDSPVVSLLAPLSHLASLCLLDIRRPIPDNAGTTRARSCRRWRRHIVEFLGPRDRRPEVMDQPGLDERLHHQALEGLRRGNLVSNTARVLWRGLEAAGMLDSRQPVRVLDVACGGGDVVLGLAQLARRRGIAFDAPRLRFESARGRSCASCRRAGRDRIGRVLSTQRTRRSATHRLRRDLLHIVPAPSG